MGSAAVRRIEQANLVAVDFDGTLARLDVDWPALRARLAAATQQEGRRWDASSGMDENLRRLRREAGESLFLRLCRIVASYEMKGFDSSTINRPLVQALAMRGDRPTAVCTANTRSAINEILRDQQFERIKPYLVAKEDVTNGKPDPEGLLKSCSRFGSSPASSLFIGDTERDRLAAEAAGFSFIWAQDML